MTHLIKSGRRHILRMSCALIGLSSILGGCHTASQQYVTSGAADDYRLRHPIAITEATKTTVVFVGHGRGGLSVTQRDDVMGVARTWVREGTGGVLAEVPVETPNAHAAAATMHDIRSVLMAGGVPASGIATRPYRPANPQELTPIRLSYTSLAATAGPCGTWPDDLGPNIDNPLYKENKQYYNFGCATQRNLAAAVANPSDLVQPRSETPAYTMRRTEGFEKYRHGNSTATSYPEGERAKLSDIGKQ